MSYESGSMTDDIEIVPARVGDPEEIARWLLETGREVFAYLFDGEERACRLFARLWQADEGSFSHRQAVMAVRGETILGLSLGYGARDKADLQARTGARFQELVPAEELAAQAARGAQLSPLLAPLPEDAFYIQNLVASPQARGSGIGALLLRHGFAEAARQGFKSLQLDVQTNNPAQHFYRAQGMQDILESRIPALVRSHDLPGTIRMVKSL